VSRHLLAFTPRDRCKAAALPFEMMAIILIGW
jgi:hypothetical protein